MAQTILAGSSASGRASGWKAVPRSTYSRVFGARLAVALPDPATAHVRTLLWLGTREVAKGIYGTGRRNAGDASMHRRQLPHIAVGLKACAAGSQRPARRSTGRRPNGRWRNGSRRNPRHFTSGGGES